MYFKSNSFSLVFLMMKSLVKLIEHEKENLFLKVAITRRIPRIAVGLYKLNKGYKIVKTEGLQRSFAYKSN